MNTSNLFLRSFILLLILVSIGFIWIMLPFYGAIFWGTTLAIIFAPVNRRLLSRFRGRRNLAAFCTLMIIILIVIIPLSLISASLIQEGIGVYKRIDSGELNLGSYFAQVVDALPPFVHDTLARLGLNDVFSIRERLSAGVLQGSKFFATQAVNVGQNTFGFLISMAVMLYLLFFLIRDGAKLAAKSRQVIPLSSEHQQHLTRKFTTVVRATVKGNIAVAAIQGALGGLIFWLLDIQGALFWAVIMAILSLLPAVGASLIWGPVAIYFLAMGDIWQGIILTLFGVLVIGLIDNLLRPLLVGKDTKLPDYVVLISTLGGLSVFGLNGFVIGPLIAALFIACWDLLPSAVRISQERMANHPVDDP